MQNNRANIYRERRLDDLLVFQASYRTFRFSRHAHEEFALGLMESGTQKFHCRGRECNAPRGSLITVNAGDIHDGMSADGRSYTYRIIYLPEKLLEKVGDEMVAHRAGHAFGSPVVDDIEIAGCLSQVFMLLDTAGSGALEIQSLFYATLAKLLNRYGSITGGSCRTKGIPRPVRRACEYIDDRATEDITLEDMAAVSGLSRFHFLRLFGSVKGITPYSYLVQRRLQIAREAIRLGAPIADAALEAHFADQSHFSRKFKSAYGITPGQYRRAVC